MDFGKWDKKEINLKAFAELSYKALRTGGTIICFYDLWKITKVQDAFIQAGFGMSKTYYLGKNKSCPYQFTKHLFKQFKGSGCLRRQER